MRSPEWRVGEPVWLLRKRCAGGQRALRISLRGEASFRIRGVRVSCGLHGRLDESA